MSQIAPCPTCPWRKSNPPGGANIPRFNIDLMRRLENTVGHDDGFRPIMACHYSEAGNDLPCIGYVAIEGYRNINVRLMGCRGKIDLRAIYEATQELDLWSSFAEMLAAYECSLTPIGKP